MAIDESTRPWSRLPRPGGPPGGAPPGAGSRDRTLGGWARLVVRRWPIVLALTLAGLALGAGYALLQPTLYAARSTLVLSPESGVLDPANSENLPAVASTIAELTVTDAVLLDARARFVESAPSAAERADREAVDLDWVKERVAAGVPAGTSLVEITGTDGTPLGASDLTEAVGASIIAQVQRLREEQTAQTGLVLAALGEPTGQGQVSPSLARDLVLGGNLGLLLGILVAVLLSDRGLRIRDRSELAGALGVAELISLPPPPPESAAGSQLTPARLTVKPDDPAEEPYRLLRSQLVAAAERGVSSVAVLGPVPPAALREAAARLGAQLCSAGASTVLVEADFHGAPWSVNDGHPPGLGEALAGDDATRGIVDIPVPIRLVDSQATVLAPLDLAVLPAGRAPRDPAAALVSPRTADLMERLRSDYRHVIVVGPSAEWQTESMSVAERTGATLLILSPGLSADQARAVKASHEAELGRLLAVAVLDGRRP